MLRRTGVPAHAAVPLGGAIAEAREWSPWWRTGWSAESVEGRRVCRVIHKGVYPRKVPPRAPGGTKLGGVCNRRTLHLVSGQFLPLGSLTRSRVTANRNSNSNHRPAVVTIASLTRSRVTANRNASEFYSRLLGLVTDPLSRNSE